MSEPCLFAVCLLRFLCESLREGLQICCGKWAHNRRCMGTYMLWVLPFSSVLLALYYLPSVLHHPDVFWVFLELLELLLQLTCWCAVESGSLGLKCSEKHCCDLWGWRLYCSGLWEGDLEGVLEIKRPTTYSVLSVGTMSFTICVLVRLLGLLVFLRLGSWKSGFYDSPQHGCVVGGKLISRGCSVGLCSHQEWQAESREAGVLLLWVLDWKAGLSNGDLLLLSTWSRRLPSAEGMHGRGLWLLQSMQLGTGTDEWLLNAFICGSRPHNFLHPPSKGDHRLLLMPLSLSQHFLSVDLSGNNTWDLYHHSYFREVNGGIGVYSEQFVAILPGGCRTP